MGSLGNLNHNIGVVLYWLFDFNYKKELFLAQESLDVKCSNFIGKELVATFRSVFYSVRYRWAPGNLKEELR